MNATRLSASAVGRSTALGWGAVPCHSREQPSELRGQVKSSCRPAGHRLTGKADKHRPAPIGAGDGRSGPAGDDAAASGTSDQDTGHRQVRAAKAVPLACPIRSSVFNRSLCRTPKDRSNRPAGQRRGSRQSASLSASFLRAQPARQGSTSFGAGPVDRRATWGVRRDEANHVGKTAIHGKPPEAGTGQFRGGNVSDSRLQNLLPAPPSNRPART